MSRKAYLVVGAVFGCLALVLVSVMSITSVTASAHAASANTGKASFAFTALITAGEHNGKPLTGGLTLNIASNTGKFSGSFHAPDALAVPVHGQVTGSQITLSFHDTASNRVIQGTGTADTTGEYTGTFNVFLPGGQKQVASGVWSGLPVANPGNVLAFALQSFITQGPDKGAVFTAAVVIDKKTLTGTFSGPTPGDLANVTVVFKDEGEQIIASYNNGQFIDAGYLLGNHDGYTGTVTVTGTADRGHWIGDFFTF